MESSFIEYLGYFIFFILFVLPRLIKFFKKKPQSGAPAPTPKPTTLWDLVEQVTGTQASPVGGAGEAEPERRVDSSELAVLEKEAAALLGVAQEIAAISAARGGAVEKLSDIAKAAAGGPLKGFATELSRAKQGGLMPTASRVIKYRDTLKQIRSLLQLLQQMVEQRVQPDPTELLQVFDAATSALLAPFIAHAERLGIPYTTRSVLTFLGPTNQDVAAVLRRHHLTVVVVERSTADRPCGWVAVVSDTFLDVYYSTTGLARRLASDLHTMPASLSLSHYADNRSLVAGLIGSYMPRLFADTAAALHLGPGFAFGLQSTALQEDTAEQTLTIAIDGSGPLPLHMRMFAACRVLSHVGFQKEAESYWEAWNKGLDHPGQIIVKDPYGRTAALPSGTLLNAVARIVDYLVTMPVASLGGAPLGSVASLVCDATSAEQMKQVARLLAQGKPQPAPARILLGAALLAAEASPTAERRIGEAVFKSLLGKGIVQEETHEQCPRELPYSLAERALHPEFVMRAIVAGEAIGHRHWGIYR